MSVLHRLMLGIGLAALLAPAVPVAQTARRTQPRPDRLTASIRGTVTAADTGTPLRGAEVRLSSGGSYSRLVTTDADGIFTLRDLPAGRYQLSVSRTGFTPLLFGQRRPLETPSTIVLDEGEAFTANIALMRGGAIYGRVIDQFGEPIAGTRVQVLRSRMVEGERRLQSFGPGDHSDDTGAFRVYGLPAGEYYVAASAGAVDAVRRDPPIYYPGTANVADAQPITLGAGGEASADIQLLPPRYARVSGIVLSSSGAPIEAMVQLSSHTVGIGPRPENASQAPPLMPHADSGPDGRFTIVNVPPGPYTLTANASFVAGIAAGAAAANPTAAPNKIMQEIMERGPEVASIPLAVSGDDVSGLVLSVRRGGMLVGTFVADAGVTRPLPTGVSVSVRSNSSNGMMMQGGRGNQFRVAGPSGPFYLDVQGLPEGWAVSQIIVDGDDVTDSPIELKGRNATARVVLTDRVTTISGVVQSRGPAANHSVVVFADDTAKWTFASRYVRTTRADEQGRFRISGLPANERYFAVALDYLEDGEQQDPQFLERLRARAMTFGLADGEQRSIYLEPINR